MGPSSWTIVDNRPLTLLLFRLYLSMTTVSFASVNGSNSCPLDGSGEGIAVDEIGYNYAIFSPSDHIQTVRVRKVTSSSFPTTAGDDFKLGPEILSENGIAASDLRGIRFSDGSLRSDQLIVPLSSMLDDLVIDSWYAVCATSKSGNDQCDKCALVKLNSCDYGQKPFLQIEKTIYDHNRDADKRFMDITTVYNHPREIIPFTHQFNVTFEQCSEIGEDRIHCVFAGKKSKEVKGGQVVDTSTMTMPFGGKYFDFLKVKYWYALNLSILANNYPELKIENRYVIVNQQESVRLSDTSVKDVIASAPIPYPPQSNWNQAVALSRCRALSGHDYRNPMAVTSGAANNIRFQFTKSSLLPPLLLNSPLLAIMTAGPLLIVQMTYLLFISCCLS